MKTVKNLSRIVVIIMVCFQFSSLIANACAYLEEAAASAEEAYDEAQEDADQKHVDYVIITRVQTILGSSTDDPLSRKIKKAYDDMVNARIKAEALYKAWWSAESDLKECYMSSVSCINCYETYDPDSSEAYFHGRHECDNCGEVYWDCDDESHTCPGRPYDAYWDYYYNSSDQTPNCDDCTDGSSSCPNASAH